MGGGHLSPVPRLWGWSVCPPPLASIPLLLPLQIPCSLVVTKLISNSCAPLPRPDSEKLKREPQSIGCCHAGPMLLGWGWMKKYKIQGNLYPFFLRCGLYCFFSIFFSNFKPPTSSSQLLCCFSEHWADSDLHCNCCAPPPPPPPPHGNLTKAPRGRQVNERRSDKRVLLAYQQFLCNQNFKNA